MTRKQAWLMLGCLLLLAGFAMAAQTLINLTTQVTGILPVANGGTGLASFAAPGQYTAVSFSATPTFTASSTTVNAWAITLTGNVTSSTLASSAAGQYLAFKICQDGTGSRTFAWPTGFSAATTIFPTLSTCTEQSFFWDGSNAQPLGPARVSGSSLSALWYGPTGTAPGTPPAGFIAAWFDSTDKALKVKNESGTVSEAIVPGSCTNQAVTGIHDAAGVDCVSIADAFFTGQLGLAHGGTNQDFSATGGAVNTTGLQVLKQNASHVMSMAALVVGDLPSTTTQTIASGSNALGTSAISSGACASTVTATATGTATTDVIAYTPNGDPTAVTGYGKSATGAVLTVYAWPTSGSVNFAVCNSTAGAITPSALTLNWRVTR